MTDLEHVPPAAIEASADGPGEALVAFAQALNAVENVAKTQTADTGKYKYHYADLGDVLDECKRACQMFGLSITQNPSMQDGFLTVGTTLIHGSGQWMTFPPIMLKMPNDAQAVGSALTYLRRYALLTIFGIAPEDDDGRAATQSAQKAEQTGGYRSEAEEMIHDHMSGMAVEDAKAMRQDFRTVFNVGLSDLPVAKHGDALTWVRQWTPPGPAEAEAVPPAGDALDAPATGSAAQSGSEEGVVADTAPAATLPGPKGKASKVPADEDGDPY